MPTAEPCARGCVRSVWACSTTVEEHSRLSAAPALALGDDFTDVLWFAAPDRSRVVRARAPRRRLDRRPRLDRGLLWVWVPPRCATIGEPAARPWTTDLCRGHRGRPPAPTGRDVEVAATAARYRRTRGAVAQRVCLLTGTGAFAARHTAGTER